MKTTLKINEKPNKFVMNQVKHAFILTKREFTSLNTESVTVSQHKVACDSILRKQKLDPVPKEEFVRPLSVLVFFHCFGLIVGMYFSRFFSC